MVSDLQLHRGDDAACGFSPYSFPHALPEKLWQVWSLQGEPKGQWEVDWHMQGGGISLNCFGPKALLCCSETSSSPRRQKWSEICLLWTGKVKWHAMSTAQPFVAACDNLGGMSLPHWLFLWEIICFRKKFCFLEGVEGDEQRHS